MIWAWLLFSQIAPGLCLYHTQSGITFQHVFTTENAYFGHSIAYVPENKRLIISAPRGDDIGQLYNCDITSRVCSYITKPFSRYPNVKYNHSLWLGAEVKAGQDYFVTCAPLDVSMDTIFNLAGAFSRCYQFSLTGNDFSKTPLQSIHPSIRYKKQKDDTTFENGMDSLGWSIDIASDDSVVIGGPALYTGRVIVHSHERRKPINLDGTMAGVSYDFGYSVLAGKFSTASKWRTVSYAIGSPYGEFGYGKVTIFIKKLNQKLQNIGNLRRDADENVVGSMFGAVLCAAKLKTRDGAYTDLLVGAPMYAPSGSHDVGAVYVYVTDQSPVPTYKRTIKGYQEGAMFGSAIVSVGDLNGDRIDEIAIGAPYENDGRGAVYLYSGADVISDVKSQRIPALQKIPAPEIQRAFGRSLAPLKDYYGNGCNELAIGAPESNLVTLFKCFASVTVNVFAKIPDLRRDKHSSGGNITSVFQACLNVTYPLKKPKTIIASLEMKVRIGHPAWLADPKDEDQIVSLISDKNEYCRSIKIVAPEDGKLPIKYTIVAKLLKDPRNETEFNENQVVLSDRSVLTTTNLIWMMDCKDSSKCVPQLEYRGIELSVENPYVVGSSKSIDMDIFVRNNGEVAYEPCVRVIVEGTNVLKPSSDCRLIDRSANELECAPKQLLRTNGTWNTKPISLETTKLTSEHKLISIAIRLYNHCAELNEASENIENITLIYDTEGVSVMGETDTGKDDIVKTDKVLGKNFDHIYTIINNGPTKWVNVIGTIVMQKRPFINSTSSMYSDNGGAPRICEYQNEVDDTLVFTCEIDELYASAGATRITVPMVVDPGALESSISKNENTVYTHLTIDLKGTPKNYTVTSTLLLEEAVVPLWIILLACFLGLLILLIIVLILREISKKTGFLQRNKKEELKRVRRSVKRQTIMRQSMRTSGIQVPSGADQQQLIDDADKPRCIQEERPTDMK